MTTELTRYDAACRALADAVAIDEVKDIRDQAMAMACYARQAKNRDLEADAVALRMRAVRRLAQLMQAQKEAVGLSKGGRPAKTGLSGNPVATLAMQGIDKNLAHQARQIGALSEQEFEQRVAETRDAVTSAGSKGVKSKRQAEGQAKGRKHRKIGSAPIGAEPIAHRAVDDAAPKEETVTVRDDVDADSEGEAARLRICVDQLQDENCHLKSVIAGLEREVADAKVAAKAPPKSKSGFRCSICHEKKCAPLRPVFICDGCVHIYDVREAAPTDDDPRDPGPIPDSLDRTKRLVGGITP